MCSHSLKRKADLPYQKTGEYWTLNAQEGRKGQREGRKEEEIRMEGLGMSGKVRQVSDSL